MRQPAKGWWQQARRLVSRPRAWTWAAVMCAVLASFLVFGIQHLQRRELNGAMSLVQDVRSARIDLAKAARRFEEGARRADGGGAEARALLEQALASLGRSLGAVSFGEPLARDAERLAVQLRRSGEEYQRQIWLLEAGTGLEIERRAAFDAVDRVAAEIDVAHRTNFVEMRARARTQMIAVLVGVTVLLGLVCVGVLAASRAEDRAFRRLALAAEAGGVDFWEENLRTGGLVWWREQATVLGKAAPPETFAQLAAAGAEQADREALREARTEALEGAPERAREVRLRRKDGEVRWVMVRLSPSGDSSGKPAVLSGALVDITERKREEAGRRETNERFRQLFEHVPVGLLFARSDGVLAAMNRRAKELLGYDIEEISPIERWWVRAYPDEGYRREMQQVWQRDLEEASRNGPEMPVREYRIVTKSGATRLFEFFGIVRGPEVIIVISDITEKRAAEERSQFHEALLEETGNIAKVGGWSFDPRTGEGYWTQEVARIHDLETTEAAAPEKRLSFYTPESRARVEAALKRACEAGEPYDLEAELVTAKGVRKWVRTIGHPVVEDGRVVRVHGSFQEITEVRRVQESLRESEGRFRTLVTLSPDALFMVQDLRVVFMNRRGLELWRARAESEIVGLSPLELIHPDSRPLVVGRIERLLASGGTAPLQELKIITRDGRPVDAESTAALMEIGGKVAIQVVVRDISERKKAERAVRLSEAKFGQAFAGNPAAISITTIDDGRVIDLNDTWVRLLGYSREEMIGRSVRPLWADAAAAARFVEQLRREGTVQGREEQFLRKSGEVLHAEIWSRVIEMDGVQAIINTLVDTTQRRVAEEALRTHQAVLEETGRIAKVGGWSFDVRTGKGYWTEEVAHIHDLDPGAPSSREIGLSFYPEPSRSAIEAAIKAAVEEGRPYDLELELISAKGVRKWVRTIGHPEKEGGVVVRLRGSFQDITEMRWMQESLRESEERFREMAQNVDEVFWMCGEKWDEVIYLSPAFERVWGRTCESVMQQPALWRKAVHPSDRARVAACMAGTGAVLAAEYRILRPDGAVRWVSDKAFPIRDAEGRTRRFVGVARDITDTKRLEEQFLRSQRLEAVGTLASGVAHDLNNILAPVLMVSGMLRRKVSGPDLKLIDMVENAARRGADIVAKMLTFSRGATGERIEMQVEPLVEEIMHLLEETLPRSIRIRREFEAGLPPINADPTRMHQVVMNLCVNARDAMPAGGQLVLGLHRRTVTPQEASLQEAVESGEFVVLSVADTGAGIAEEIRHRIFDPFFTTKEVGKGTGLGLPTVLGIVRSHGGFIEVQSEVGKGTRFEVFLPAGRKALATTGLRGVAGGDPGTGETVLVVDDEENIRVTVRQALESSGYQVIEARDGRAALEVFAQADGRVDLVLSDIMMPEMDGWALARELRARAPDLPIVLCTGVEQGVAPGQLAELRIAGLLKKPYSLSTLLDELAAALRGGRGPAAG